MLTDERPLERLLAVLAPVLAVSNRIAVQLRRPGAPGRAVLEEARRLAELCARSGNRLFVNDRLDVALALGLDFHAPAHGFAPAEARPLLGGDVLLSCAVHDPAEAARALGADLALVSPVFETPSKPGAKALGAAGFARLARAVPCAAFALGGVDPASAALLSGLAGVAVIRAVLDAPDPAAAARTLLQPL